MSREELRGQLGVDADETLVLVTPGGGEDGHSLAACYLEGLGATSIDGLHSVVVSGPEMSADKRSALQSLAAGRPDVTTLEFSDDMMSYVAASDLMVSMGGYNTVCEFLSAGRRSVVVPRARPVSEQLIRARLLHERGVASFLHPDALTPSSVNRALTAEMERQGADLPTGEAVDMRGLDRVERELSTLLAHG